MAYNEELIRNGLQKIASDHHIHFRAMLNMSGGQGWINYKRVEENDYRIQISTGGRFEEYQQIRDAVITVFSQVDSVLISEEDYGNRTFGFQKELFFMDREKRVVLEEKTKAESAGSMNVQTYINGDVHAGGNINTGNADRIDNQTVNNESETDWFKKEIVKMGLSFICGVLTTLVAQWIMRRLGWM